MAMDFWFHIYARKSQNYPGSRLRFENNFLLIIGIISKKFLFVFYWWCNKTKQQKTNQKFKSKIQERTDIMKHPQKIQWARAAGFDFNELEKVLSKTERRLQTKSQNKKWFEKINRFYLKAYMAFTYGNCSKEQKAFYENVLFRCLAHYRKYAKAAYTWMSLEKDA